MLKNGVGAVGSRSMILKPDALSFLSGVPVLQVVVLVSLMRLVLLTWCSHYGNSGILSKTRL